MIIFPLSVLLHLATTPELRRHLRRPKLWSTMLLAALSYWVVGFTLAYVLAFPAGMGAMGIWIGLATGLAIAAALLSLRFRRQSRRGYLPEVTTSRA